MKEYAVILLQLIIWSGYTFFVWLSKHDQPLYNWLMFMVFLYLGFLIGNMIMKSTRKTVLITFLSLVLYGSLQISLSFIHV